jgi:hypothetical protein
MGCTDLGKFGSFAFVITTSFVLLASVIGMAWTFRKSKSFQPLVAPPPLVPLPSIPLATAAADNSSDGIAPLPFC